ncbi:hypothetical protein [Paenibacillus glycanilyticus]|uniref:DUF998 domain-containing protein n=1 Tax=Paenibacillus glycanilyticus TaxID=126569 RepID=A0ABQ6GAE3_9BACL|nr:hypothetical protein [Paenibacillus glycanilyticus]GLX67455.1 hypothetical protein MU1_18000 [Paenibacillus glycanilyticus]
MSTASLQRFSGFFLIVAPIIGVFSAFASFFTDTSLDAPASNFQETSWIVYNSLLFLGGGLLTFGLPAFYIKHLSGSHAKLSLIGTFLYALSLLLALPMAGFLISILPYLADTAPDAIHDSFGTNIAIFPLSSFLLQLIGSILICIAITRSKTSPSYVGILLLLAAVLNVCGIAATGVTSSIISLLSWIFIAISFGSVGAKFMKS